MAETLAAKNLSFFQLFEKAVKQKMRGKGAAGFMETAVQKHVQERMAIVVREVRDEVTHKYDMK